MLGSTSITPHSFVALSLSHCVIYLTLPTACFKLKSSWIVSRQNFKIQPSRKETTYVTLLKNSRRGLHYFLLILQRRYTNYTDAPMSLFPTSYKTQRYLHSHFQS